MDPLDPLTEIINSGNAFSIAISLERLVWVIIGIFFIGAISTSIGNGIRNQQSLGKKSFLNYFKDTKNEDESSQSFSSDDK